MVYAAKKREGKIKRNHLLLLSHSHTRFITAPSLLGKELEVSRLRRRTHLEAVAEILETAKNGVKKATITYRCNLNYVETEKFLSYLTETGLLRLGNSYHTTEKGLRLLKAYHTLKLLLSTRNYICGKNKVKDALL